MKELDNAKEFIKHYLNYNHVNYDEFMGKCRERQLVYHRTIVSVVLVKMFDLGLVDCGRLINRDHSSIIHHCKKFEDLCGIYKEYNTSYMQAVGLANIYIQDEVTNDFVSSILTSNSKLREKLLNKGRIIENLQAENVGLKLQIKKLKKELDYV